MSGRGKSTHMVDSRGRADDDKERDGINKSRHEIYEHRAYSGIS